MEFMSPIKSKLFCLGSWLRQNVDQDQLQKRGWLLANRCLLCKSEEESIDHIKV